MSRILARSVSRTEFIVVMALMMSFVALSTDIMLPALGEIDRDLATRHPNDRQLVVVTLFFGLVVGQLFWGPLSDSFGRKPAILLGSLVFIGGCLISAVSHSMEIMLLGRFLQGVGAASARVVTVALVRDRFSGNEMARVLSLIMSVFILIPMLAPAMGQAILWVSTWRTIFVAILIHCVAVQIWFSLRQPETLAPRNRLPFRLDSLRKAFLEVCANRATAFYTLSGALMFGIFVAYLSSAQQIFQDLYGTGDRFALYFAVIAASIGLAMSTNSAMVLRVGMHRLSAAALLAMVAVSMAFLALTVQYGGKPPFAVTLSLLFLEFFPIGILFVNMNALAMEPHGRIAGMASTVINMLTTLGSLVIGTLIARAFNFTLYPLAAGSLILSILSFGTYRLAVKRPVR
ncbi:MAG: multidrug effflux MFS transporter [Gammaproteobacteria bacterium]|nr:multidrug effflux MFS transporter [Gammaproteobacteria bacterium]MYD75173.1 multidrug effflux MFS transporter [Gammaproteobacteria bacterium]MYJ51570.1 multidrug effflux MFS transporter [Gammaproteobacteria bacterium]